MPESSIEGTVVDALCAEPAAGTSRHAGEREPGQDLRRACHTRIIHGATAGPAAQPVAYRSMSASRSSCEA